MGFHLLTMCPTPAIGLVMSLYFFHSLNRSRRAAGITLLVGLLAGVAFAQEAVRATPPPVMVTGKVYAADSAKGFALTAAVLEKLPQKSFTTNAPWTKAPQTYTGVLLRDVLAHLGASGTQVQATALNDYAITIPVDDARQFDVIIAYKIDGQLIPVRDRGPLLVMYPFDARPELQRRHYYERAIWQLKSLSVQ